MDEYQPDSLSKNEAFASVAREQRRRIIQVLLEDCGVLTVETLAREVATRTQETVTDPTETDIERKVELALMHRDLPKLAEEGIVTFDSDDRTVTAGDHIGDLETLV